VFVGIHQNNMGGVGGPLKDDQQTQEDEAKESSMRGEFGSMILPGGPADLKEPRECFLGGTEEEVSKEEKEGSKPE